MKKLLRVLRTFRDPLSVLADRLGYLKAAYVDHTLRNGLSFKVRPGGSDTMILYDIFADREYQPKDLPQFTLQPGWKVLDLGGNIGAFTLQAAAAGATVDTYEPMPDNFRLLLENVHRNGFDRQTVRLTEGAVSDKVGRLRLHRKAGSSSAFWHTGEPSVDVDTYGIAEVLAKAGPIDLLKCDIEGAEFTVFEAMTAEHFAQIKRVVMEYHDFENFDHITLVRQLRRHGFEVWDRPKAKGSIYGLIFAERRYL